MALLFAVGFSGSPVTMERPATGVFRQVTRPIPRLVSAGGANFFHVDAVTPLGADLRSGQGCHPVDRHGPPCAEPAEPVAVSEPHSPGLTVGAMAGVDRWRDLVSRYFAPDDVDRALDIIRCESHGNPDAANPISSARGLFQHLASMWPERAAQAGRPGADIYDPDANIAVAAWLVYHGGGWQHWNASGGCW